MFRLAVLVSGSGSNLQAVMDAVQNGTLRNIEIVLVVSNVAGVKALDRAELAGIPHAVVDKKNTAELLSVLALHNADGILLAGYLPIVPVAVTDAYKGRIINIHPSLIPKFSGKGFYGIKVHEAVIESEEKVTGATVHFVDEGIDTGGIIMQKTVSVLEDDTPETLQLRVLEIEHEIVVEGVRKLVKRKEG